jgi:hypothetical protein
MNIQALPRYLVPGFAIILALTLGANPENLAYATSQNQIESHTVTGQDLSNNPMVAKILSEIEYSKKQVALLQKNQRDAALNDKLIAEQRIIVKNLQDQALQIMALEANKTSSKTAFNNFVSKVQNNSTKLVFLDEFDFTTKRIDAGHAAMKKILDNGGTYDEAIQEFSKYAAIKRVEMIEINKNLNVKYGLADAKTQADFNSNGNLPDDYIKVPDTVLSHAKT